MDLLLSNKALRGTTQSCTSEAWSFMSAPGKDKTRRWLLGEGINSTLYCSLCAVRDMYVEISFVHLLLLVMIHIIFRIGTIPNVLGIPQLRQVQIFIAILETMVVFTRIQELSTDFMLFLLMAVFKDLLSSLELD